MFDLSTRLGCLRQFATYPSPRFLIAQLSVALLVRPFLGAPTWIDALICGGVLVYWPLQEWAAHKTLLHAKPRRLFGSKIDPGWTHRHHHRNPEQLETAILPIGVVLAIAPIHLALWWLITPDLARMCTGVTAFTAATLVYEWVHFLTHTEYRPRGRYYAWIRRNHRMHHFRHEGYWYSFTAPFLDTAFGTGPHPADVPHSKHCHDLGVDDTRGQTV